MANLEYSIPITSQTIFKMGSVSKQFTGFAIALLVQEGKVNLDDDIRKYLPWFPDMKQKITIRQILTHTSGIRDHDQLLDIAGVTREDVITQKKLIRILSMQKTLNFEPGEQNLYSNSGFTLAAEIVSAVTRKSFRAFTDSAIFKPLGMSNTHFQDDYTEIIPDLASSYEAVNKEHYKNSIHNSSAVGSEGLVTNIEDLSKWVMNLYNPKDWSRAAINLLTHSEKLNNGTDIHYGLGIMIGGYNGARRYFHTGITGGYRNSIAVFPDKKLGVIYLANNGDFGTLMKSVQLEGLFIKNDIAAKPGNQASTKSENDAVIVDTVAVKPYLGSYVSENGDTFSLVLENKKLYQKTRFQQFSEKYLFIRTTRDTFVNFYNPASKLVLKWIDPSKSAIEQYANYGKGIAQKYDPDQKFTDNELLAYTGKYYCPELDCSYLIRLKDHQLLLRSNYYDDTPLTLYGKNQLGASYRWMYNLNIVRNRADKITGFEVNCAFIQDLRFDKLK
jgi:CubicO group peptidase (beta-lactamase class C family)